MRAAVIAEPGKAELAAVDATGNAQAGGQLPQDPDPARPRHRVNALAERNSATMSQQIRRVLVRSLDDITIEQVPAPVPGSDELLVRATVVGVCGSDTHAAAGHHPFIDLPYRPGHEAVGVVAATGEGAEDFAPGDRVIIEPNLYCGTCPQCRSGRYNICQELKVFGCQTPGAMTDLFTIAADRVHRVPDGMTDIEAALVEPLATPVNAVAKAGDLTGRTVAVLGAGPIGLLTLIAARHAGAARIAVTDPLESKRDRALRLGAAVAVPAEAPDLAEQVHSVLGGPVDVVFDCVAREQSMAQAVDLVAKGGHVVVVGVGAAGTTPIRLDLVQDREIRIEGTLMYTAEDYRTAISLIASGAVDVGEMVTATYGLGDAGKAFAAAVDPEHVKVLVTVAGP
ncbi:zinc-dependent alcohol dehydrogenase [Streptomyces sp. 3N207]|uniref:zinc-dependent alcohol dehydrogenase n=1 Tax=Streptomyces sp. 3N207 TaxID=3457417 RepID=UPI003FD1A139